MARRIGKNEQLKWHILIGEPVLAPGVYDMISARLADRLGFGALFMTGYGVAASHLGVPDTGLATYTDMVERLRHMAAGTDTPLIADADTGYGGLLNVRQTVRGFEEAGASAIQLVDQETPRSYGCGRGVRAIPARAMADKIKVAADSRSDADFLIIARTDVRSLHGLDEALQRGEAYVEAGADVLAIEQLQDEREYQTVASRFDVPLMANLADCPSRPPVGRTRLGELGFKLLVYPTAALLAATAALDRAYARLMTNGSSLAAELPLYGVDEMNRLLGFDELSEFERRYEGDDAAFTGVGGAAPQGQRQA